MAIFKDFYFFCIRPGKAKIYSAERSNVFNNLILLVWSLDSIFDIAADFTQSKEGLQNTIQKSKVSPLCIEIIDVILETVKLIL